MLQATPTSPWKTYILFMLMQIIGGLGGLGAGRCMRQYWVPSNPEKTTKIYRISYNPWYPPIHDNMANHDIGATTEMLFCEVFASFLICTVFMTLRFRSITREGIVTKERDSVLIALALSATVLGTCSMIKSVSGTFCNPAVSFSEFLTSLIFCPDNSLAWRYVFARLAGPFIGAIIAGLFFMIQREVLNEADNLFQSEKS